MSRLRHNCLGRPLGYLIFRACGTGRPGRRSLAHPALVTWNVFLGLKTLFSLVKLKAAKSGVPIVFMMFLYEARARARARASYRNIGCTIGTPFWLDWDQEESKTQGNHQK